MAPSCRTCGLPPSSHDRDADGRLVCPRSFYDEAPEKVPPGTSDGEMRYDSQAKPARKL